MLNRINTAIERLNVLSERKIIKVISHFDTDGITSAAIISRALQRWNKKFSVKIVKSLDEETINSFPEDQIWLFLDLASNIFNYLKNKNTEIFILDHHELSSVESEIPKNIFMINPVIHYNNEPISGSAVCYLFAKAISQENKDLASLALVGMVGDCLEKKSSKTFEEIVLDSNTTIKRGLLLYPSTRPLDKALEYSSGLYIPGVTGCYSGAVELLKDANIPRIDGHFKSLHELSEAEMSGLITAIMLRTTNQDDAAEMIGNLYLVKIFNKLEDAREFSALINACSRMDNPEIAMGFCLGNKNYIELAEKKYIEYKQQLISALKFIQETDKISGKKYTIINAKDNIKDTIIGTVTSIISRSPVYEEGTIIIGLAYNNDKIKVSARISGKEGRNLREVLTKIVVPLGGEVGGHSNAAGCLISKDKESQFIQELQKTLEIELIKV